MAALEKIYKCLSCGQDIKLELKSDGSPGWLKWNLDGSKHIDAKKSKQQSQAVIVDDGPPQQGQQQQIAELTKQVSDLKETVNILISQIQGLRSEIRQQK